MTILFSTLPDLTSFLQVRDDNDFEKILSKEVLSETSTMLRILGTFTVGDTEEKQNQTISTDQTDQTALTTSTQSACATSSDAVQSACVTSLDAVKTIRLFVGSAPVSWSKVVGHPSNSSADGDILSKFTSTLFQQDFRHHCSLRKCFLAPWTVKEFKSNLTVDCVFNLDGTVSNDQLSNYFLLNWKQLTAPSTTKWTRDVQEVSDNCPGIIQLKLPAIVSTSRRNVQSLVALLDEHIEEFMKIRSIIHSSSSFK